MSTQEKKMKNKKLIAKRMAYKLPTHKMAEVIGVSCTCLKSLEAGNPGKIKTATKVANFYGAEPEEIGIRIYKRQQVNKKLLDFAKEHNKRSPIDIKGIKERTRERGNNHSCYLGYFQQGCKNK